MKIGIITIHNSPSYGASLQSFALYEFLRQQGYDCEIIDLHRPHQKDFKKSKKYLPYREKTSLVLKLKLFVLSILRGGKSSMYSKAAYAKFVEFNNQIVLSESYLGVDDLYKQPPLYDVYISGSDQLWNPAQPFCIEPYFLTFAPEGKKKISYASSIGLSKLENNETEDFKRWLNDFDAIAVREPSAKKLLNEFVDKPIATVCDPTFLLTQQYWKSIAVFPKREKKYILIFTLNYSERIINYAKKLSEESGYDLLTISMTQEASNDESYTVINDAGPREFIGYIANAEIVITDSFHGTVFSLIMGANNFFSYIAVGNKRGSRIIDLLSTYNLSNHLLPVDLNESFAVLNEKSINKEAISTIMTAEREKSSKYLLDNI